MFAQAEYTNAQKTSAFVTLHVFKNLMESREMNIKKNKVKTKHKYANRSLAFVGYHSFLLQV